MSDLPEKESFVSQKRSINVAFGRPIFRRKRRPPNVFERTQILKLICVIVSLATCVIIANSFGFIGSDKQASEIISHSTERVVYSRINVVVKPRRVVVANIEQKNLQIEQINSKLESQIWGYDGRRLWPKINPELIVCFKSPVMHGTKLILLDRESNKDSSHCHFRVKGNTIRTHWDSRWVFHSTSFAHGNEVILGKLEKKKHIVKKMYIANQKFKFHTKKSGTYYDIFQDSSDLYDFDTIKDHSCAFLHTYYFSTKQMLERSIRAYKEINGFCAYFVVYFNDIDNLKPEQISDIEEFRNSGVPFFYFDKTKVLHAYPKIFQDYNEEEWGYWAWGLAHIPQLMWYEYVGKRMTNLNRVWQMENDLVWTGDLGFMLQDIDQMKGGYIASSSCDVMKKGWIHYKQRNYIEKPRACMCFFTRVSTQLLSIASNDIKENRIAYCEMVFPSLCEMTDGCEFDSTHKHRFTSKDYWWWDVDISVEEYRSLNQSKNLMFHRAKW